MPSFEIRPATPDDVNAIAAAHLDSIRAVGAQFYERAVVDAWAAGIDGNLYLNAMREGEKFFVAMDRADCEATVLGFSTHNTIGSQHRTAVYVRGAAVRAGIGSALFKVAEADALAAGAEAIDVSASLAAVEFYTANGFHELGRGEHELQGGERMACVDMRKDLRDSL